MPDKPPVRTAPWMQDTLRQGFALLNQGQVNEAAHCARRLLGAKPDLVEAHFLVGLIALEMRDTKNAVHAFGSVTKLKPDHAAAWANLARLFVQMGHNARADQALQQAVVHNDNVPVVMDLIATVHARLGDQQEAARWNQKALDSQPEHIPFLINMANNHMFFDRLDEADSLLGKVFSQVPGHPNGHWLKSGLRKARDYSHVDEMRALVADEAQHPRALAFLYYALGKELEDLEDWHAAFNAFAHGAANRRRTLDFDEQREIDMFHAFEEIFTEDWLQDGPAGNESCAPIFVVGQPRTGTTLVERIMTAHSQVHSAGELQQLGQCIRRLSNYSAETQYAPELARAGSAVDPRRLGDAYLQTTQKFQGSTPRFVDKLPPNYLFIPLILKALPNAKIVHLQRNPMDACFASFKQLFADAYPHSYEQGEMARHHARYFRLMDVWRQRFGDRFFDISYEQTAANLEPNARALIEYLELPWEDACLDFHKQDTAVTTASAVQVRQPAHTRSIGRWRRYETQLAPMRQALDAQGVPLEL